MLACYYKYYLVGCLLLLLASCVEPYRPDVIQLPHNYLVVDGFINSNGRTTIRLSRTLNLDDAKTPPGEANAQVLIEEEGGPQFTLAQGTNGNYTSQPLRLNPTRRYRLRIRTADNQEYASDFVENKITPPIDSISWKTESDGLQIYVNTHDAEQKTHYYRWKYDETWEFTTPFYSLLEYKNNQMVDRREDISHCWRGSSSSAISISSTAKLRQDVVSEFPLVKLPDNSIKIKYKYSILVKQYAQTQEAYEYAETLKKNTENIGTLFDPLPTQLTGNIKCLSDPAEPVIGFVSVASEEVKRIFIKRGQLPPTWRSLEEYAYCELDTVLAKDAATTFRNGGTLPIAEIMMPAGFTASSVDCVDCRLRGTNVKPDFWE
ncbi:hypothetical protein AAE02nite_51090 [Adhaeribacter aerolatus]|uniref:DUF4249 domain-containing protein n=1 Tax=Adhaeribacter aerolatus TaxID=670289 RepID=A0A512B662_9BACT|nr:DUF4249 domain-containing protein [Adhaeribacter aerolatus]GEO07445.1 hypothetical protein AAE02nite_51090 [Adhaeribacter aerolatus]